METIYGKCQYCDGTGKTIVDEHSIDCTRCNGIGRSFFADVSFDDMIAKLDSIVVEQASVRADLTAALTAIYNKVKNL